MPSPRRSMRPLTMAEVMAVLGAAVCGFAPLSPEVVEKSYSIGVYPWLQRFLTPLSNRLPFAILDVLVVAVVIAVAVAVSRAVREARRKRSVLRLLATLVHLCALGATVYILFLLLWGF